MMNENRQRQNNSNNAAYFGAVASQQQSVVYLQDMPINSSSNAGNSAEMMPTMTGGLYVPSTVNGYVYSAPIYYDEQNRQTIYNNNSNNSNMANAYVIQEGYIANANTPNNRTSTATADNSAPTSNATIQQLQSELESTRLQLRSLLQERVTQQEIMRSESQRTRMLEDELNVAITEIARLTQVNDEMEKLIHHSILK